MKTCQRCGYQWEPRNLNPKACPSCKSYRWNLARQNPPIEPTTTGTDPNPGDLTYEIEES